MRAFVFRTCLLSAVVLLAACSQALRRPQPAPVVEQSKSPQTTAAATPAPPTKPKAKTKPVSKPESKDTDVSPSAQSATAAAPEGIERDQVGYYFDTLQGRLRQLVDPAIAVTHSDGHISVDVTRRVHFESDDATLPARECSALTPVAKALIEYRMTRIVADVSATGEDEASLKSARLRAAAVTQCLSNAGVASHRLSARQVAMTSDEQQRTVLRIEPIIK